MATSPRASVLVLPVILVAALVISLGISGTAIALPPISRDLGSNSAGLQWVVNGFNTTFAAFTLIWGVLADRIGARLTFVAGLLFMIGGSTASVFAGSLLSLDIARLVAGVGGAALITAGSSILSNAYEGPARSRAFALFGTTIGIGLSFGPTLSGLLVEGVGWRGIFVVFTALSVLSIAGSWSLPRVKIERVPGQRAIDFSVLRNPGYLALVLVPTAGAIGFVTILTYLPTALSAIDSMAAGAAGIFVLPLTLPVFLGPLLAAFLIRRVAKVRPMTVIYIALACLVLGDLGLLLLTPGINPAWIVAPMVLLGFGFGLPIGLVDGEALSRVPARQTGTAAGVLDFVRQGSEAVAVGAFAAILSAGIALTIRNPKVAQLTAAGVPGHAAQYAATLHWIVIGLAAICLLLTVVIAALDRKNLLTHPAS